MGKVTEEVIAKPVAANNVKKGSPTKRKGQRKEKKSEQQVKKELILTKKMGQKGQKNGNGDEISKKQGSIRASSPKNCNQRHFKLKQMGKKINQMRQKIDDDKKRARLVEDDDDDDEEMT